MTLKEWTKAPETHTKTRTEVLTKEQTWGQYCLAAIESERLQEIKIENYQVRMWCCGQKKFKPCAFPLGRLPVSAPYSSPILIQSPFANDFDPHGAITLTTLGQNVLLKMDTISKAVQLWLCCAPSVQLLSGWNNRIERLWGSRLSWHAETLP